MPDQTAEPRPAVRPASRFEVSTLASEAPALPDGSAISIAGRLMLWRRFGGLVFGHIQDRSGRVQIAIRRDEMTPESFSHWAKALRVGDFIGVRGEMFTTGKGERTVGVRSLELLNQAHRPLPDKWLGISNPEVRARKRYLDLLTNPVVRERFQLRGAIIREVRSLLDSTGFLEVETPIMQQAASGAAARPFITHHNALDEDLYLRISPETFLKRLVAGGLDRVYEIGKNFRNEGIDTSHLQEFTMLEWYAAYWDYIDNTRMVQSLIQHVLDEVVHSRVIESADGVVLNFDGDWPVFDYGDLILKETGVDLRIACDLRTLRDALSGSRYGIDLTAPSYAQLVDQLYKKTVRPKLIQPCFLAGHPVELVPLARRSDEDPRKLDMFQLVVNSWELVKAYSELVDPLEQRARFEEQAEMRANGDDETMMMEEDFLEAMELGMPPMSGAGLGIDRLVAIVAGVANLREVVLFPSLRAHASVPGIDS